MRVAIFEPLQGYVQPSSVRAIGGTSVAIFWTGRMDDDTERAERAKRSSPYLTTAQAAHFLKLSPRTLQRMRAKGSGPTPRRHAVMVLYHIDDLETWSCARADRAKAKRS